MTNGDKCLEILDNYWTELESAELVDSFSPWVKDNSAVVNATYMDVNGNLIHIEISMCSDDFAENLED